MPLRRITLKYLPLQETLKAASWTQALLRIYVLMQPGFEPGIKGAYERMRQGLFERYGINVNLSEKQVSQILVEKRVIDVLQLNGGRTSMNVRSYKLEIMRVTVKGLDLEMFLVSADDIYEALKARLYSPFYQPTEATFRFQLCSWGLIPVDNDLSNSQLIQTLITKGVLIIEERYFETQQQGQYPNRRGREKRDVNPPVLERDDEEDWSSA